MISQGEFSQGKSNYPCSYGWRKGKECLVPKCRIAQLSGRFARGTFAFFEKYFGIHVTPADFYSPIPLTSELNDTMFEYVCECKGINWQEQIQFNFLDRVVPKYFAEFVPQENAGLTLVDTYLLYTMIRERKPKVMIEIGAGDSTHISLLALDRNCAAGHDCTFYSVEPYPRDDVRAVRRNHFELVVRKVQDVGLELLSSADILFIDSSHVSKIGSDVNYEICEILPRLQIGSLIHWHDIPMPRNYWEDWIRHGNMFWNESYMLHAFLLFNDSFRILWASQYLYLKHYGRLREKFPYMKPEHRLSSLWVERIG